MERFGTFTDKFQMKWAVSKTRSLSMISMKSLFTPH